MPSKVQIANIALTTYLGKGRVNSIDDRSPAAQQIDIHYDEVRREILSEWPWPFAIRHADLARVTINDRPEWQSKFALPAKTLRLNWVNDQAAAKDAILCRTVYDTPRMVQGGFIYSDLETAVAEYVADVDDPTTYPPKFTQAMAALLAARVAMPLTESGSKARGALDTYYMYLDEAKVAAVQLHPPIVVMNSRNWAEVR